MRGYIKEREWVRILFLRSRLKRREELHPIKGKKEEAYADVVRES